MAHRNFSMIDYFDRCMRDWVPALSFRGETAAEWESWRAEASAKLAELLGEFPESVDPAAETVYSVEDNGLVRERVIFDSEAEMSVPCTVLRPVEMPRDGKAGAILCSHGHGPYGKEPVAGNDTSEGLLAGYRGVERIYSAAGASDRLWADVHPGEHAFAGNRAFDFFEKYL